MIDLGIDFLGISAPFCSPSWAMLVPFSVKMGDVLARRPLFVALVFFFLLFRCFDSILAPFGLHLGGSGNHLGSIWKVFGAIMVPS